MKDSHIKVYGRSPGDRGEMDLYENKTASDRDAKHCCSFEP